jgi:uncharacterized protein
MNTIKVRHVNFQKETETPRNWLWGNYLTTHFLNSLHLIFPDGEKFFIRSVKDHEEFIKDPELKKRVKSFIAQEIIHGNEHKKFWSTLQKQGYDIDTFLNFYNESCYENLEVWMKKFRGSKHGLAVTVALEHLTASLAEYAIVKKNELAGAHENLRTMLLWHAAEEIEHKSVAFDVLKEVDPSYQTRMIGLLHAICTLSFYTLVGFFFFMKQEVFDRKTKISIFEIWEFIVQLTELMQTMVKEISVYLKPDFHPDQVPNDHLAVYFFEKYKVEKQKAEGEYHVA